MTSISVIIPTYCEAVNLESLIPQICEAVDGHRINLEIIVVDDDSTDGTSAVIDKLQQDFPVRLIVRKNERGLATAVVRGMEEAKGDILVVLDADLSHPPEHIPEFVERLKDPEIDFAIGSRYTAGGSTPENWGVFRGLNSSISTMLARPLTAAKDPMAGYFALRRSTFQRVQDEIDPIGYKIALELIVKANCRNIAEVPIQFEDRKHGESKLNLGVQVSYLRHLGRLYRHAFWTSALQREQPGAVADQEQNPFRFTWKIAVFGLMAAFCCALIFTLIRRDQGELAVYNKAAQRYVAGERFYRPEEGRGFTYPPFFILPSVPYSYLPELPSRVLWNFTNFVLLGGILGIVFSRIWRFGRRFVWAPTILVVLLAATYVQSPIEYQGHDLIVFFLSLLAIVFWDSRQRASGVCAGLAAACKATPLLFLPVFLIQRRFVAGAFMGLALIGATLLPDVLVPANSGELTAVTWYRSFIAKVEVGAPAQSDGGAWTSWNLHNQSLSGTLHRWFTPYPYASQPAMPDVAAVSLDGAVLRALILAAQAAIFAFLLWIAFRFPRTAYPQRPLDLLGLGAMVLAGMTLLSPMSNTPHFCVLLVPIAYLTFHFCLRRRDGFVAGTLALVFLVSILTAKDLVGVTIKTHAMAYGAHTMATVCCFLATGAVLLRQYPAVPAAGPKSQTLVVTQAERRRAA